MIINNIKKQKNALPNTEDLTALLTSQRYCQFILTFTQWLIQLEKNTCSEEKKYNIKTLSQEILENSWEAIYSILQEKDHISVRQFLAHQGKLQSNLLTSLSFGNIFSKKESDHFHSHWLDIQQGLNELSMLNLISEAVKDEEGGKDEADEQVYKLKDGCFTWIKRKEKSVLHALQQSKQQILIKQKYWTQD